VTWWTSTFDRIRRENVCTSDHTISLKEGVRIKLLHSPGYKKSISLARVKDQRHVARKFTLCAEGENPPDIILSAYPTVELCKSAIEYGYRHRVPVVLDMRDMWPDIILDSIPKAVRTFARIFLYPMIRDSRYVCSRAAAITGITDEFVNWGLNRGNRERTPLDRSFPLAYITKPPPKNEIGEAEHFWDKLGISKAKEDFVACFIGTIGHQFDLETPIRAARILSQSGRRVKLVFCGSGDRLESYKKLASEDERILFPGWVDAAKMYVLLRRASVGLNPFPERYDFLSTINNKAIEYMSAGLPVLSSPKKGVLYRLLKMEECGTGYEAGDAAALSRTITELYDDPCRLKRWSENAKGVFERDFNADIVYADMARYLGDIADRFRRRAEGPVAIHRHV
jgi:glycosyltransferase involved in cell wall biosynthesis